MVKTNLRSTLLLDDILESALNVVNHGLNSLRYSDCIFEISSEQHSVQDQNE